jgi:hypothetical protein
MKAYNVADLLYAAGWRSSCDAQYEFLTNIVQSDELLDAILADRKEMAMAEATDRVRSE